ncbi:hypothetical protein [Streptomyces althioticus]|uniref:hypothetical protein n=1 Tax=Streptomyces althioticus TaxID=83380 RepID=UPI0036A0032B
MQWSLRGHRGEPSGGPAEVRRGLQSAGLNAATIVTVLPCLGDDGERLGPTCPGLLANPARERQRITRAITDLQSARAALDAVISAAPADVAERAAAIDWASAAGGGFLTQHRQ